MRVRTCSSDQTKRGRGTSKTPVIGLMEPFKSSCQSLLLGLQDGPSRDRAWVALLAMVPINGSPAVQNAAHTGQAPGMREKGVDDYYVEFWRLCISTGRIRTFLFTNPPHDPMNAVRLAQVLFDLRRVSLKRPGPARSRSIACDHPRKRRSIVCRIVLRTDCGKSRSTSGISLTKHQRSQIMSIIFLARRWRSSPPAVPGQTE